MAQRNYIGVGMRSPRTLVSGSVQLVTGVDLIQQSIARIIGEQYGTRFFNYGFGSRINEILFEPNLEIQSNLMRVFVFDAIRKWEKRVEVVDVVIERSLNTLQASATVKVLPSNEIHTFIFPVYDKLTT